jgi:hypothetical protein
MYTLILYMHVTEHAHIANKLCLKLRTYNVLLLAIPHTVEPVMLLHDS